MQSVKFFFIYILIAMSSLTAWAQQYKYDSSWAGNGVSFFSQGASSYDLSYLNNIISLNGEVIGCGAGENIGSPTNQYYPIIVKYNASGQLDNSFGSNGVIEIAESFDTKFLDIAYTDSNKLIAIGNFATGTEVKKYLSNGTIDSSFGTYGTVNLSNYKSSYSNDQLKIQPDGKILIIYSRNATERYIKRLLPNGQDDTSFSLTGFKRIDSIGFPRSLDIDMHGNIYILGTRGGQNVLIKLLKLSKYGVTVSSFGTNGIAEVGPPLISPNASPLDITSKKILVTEGHKINVLAEVSLSAKYFAIFQLDSNGNSNQNFGISGYYLEQHNRWSIDIQEYFNGNILLASQIQIQNLEHSITQIGTDGKTDSTFNVNGTIAPTFGDQLYGGTRLLLISIAANDKGEIFGSLWNANTQFSIVKYKTRYPLNTQNLEHELINIYPNPANDYLIVNINLKKCSYRIHNAIGEQISSSTIPLDNKIIVSGLKNGIYFLTLYNSNQQYIGIKKIIVNK